MRSLIAATAALLLVACEPLPPSGGPDGGDPDGGVPDGGGPDGGGNEVGTLVKSADEFQTVRGLTSDGYVVLSSFVDPYTVNLTARPVMGGAAESIATLPSQNTIAISGSVVFAFHGTGSLAPLTVWSKGTGSHQTSRSVLVSSSTRLASADGAFITYTAPAETSGQFDAFVAPTDLSAETPVFTASACGGVTSFAKQRLITFHCIPGANATAVHEAGTWEPLILAPDADYNPSWATNGEVAFLVEPKTFYGHGPASLFDLGTGAKTPIDAAALGPVMKSDGTALFYSSYDTLKRYEVGAAAPVELLTTTLDGVLAVSPGFKYVTYLENYQSGPGTSDVMMASAEVPSVGQLLVAGTTELLPRVIFTQDDGFIVYESAVSEDGLTGTTHYRATAGGEVQLLGEVGARWMGRGSWIIYADNPVRVDGTRRGDLHLKNLSSGAAPVLIASGIDLYSVRMHPDRTHLVFRVFGTESSNGVYGYVLP